MYRTEKQVLRLEHGSGSDESDQPTDGHGEVLFNVLFNCELIIFFFEIEYFVLAFSKHLNPGSLAWEATSH